jgi:uncharacterized protein involved in copper resistance
MLCQEEAVNARQELANSMMEYSENIAPLFDAADGMKADLERRGWSPTMAEGLAATWLQGALTHIWKVAQP